MKLKNVSKTGKLTLICKECGGFQIKCIIYGHIKGISIDGNK